MIAQDGHDCIVIGGGPAGATAAALLAKKGRRVLVLERDEFPRHHVGESLMPETFSTFERLGLLEKLKESSYPVKESVQFVNARGEDSAPFFFTDRDPSPCSRTWQVQRDDFDRMMIENARESGAEVRFGVRAKEVLFEGDRAIGVRTLTDKGPRDLFAKVIIDASGTHGLLSKQLGIREQDPFLRNAAIYGYFKGAYRDQGRNAGATLIISTPDRQGWFWSIPLPNDITSIGVVGQPSYLMSGRGSDPLKTFEEEIEKTPGVKKRLESAERVGEVRVISDFSYKSSKVAGDGWVLVGDAYGFIDPVYSSGVFLALKSGEFAADAIDEALSAGDVSEQKLGAFGEKLSGGMNLLRRLVYAFYDPSFSIGRFTKAHPEFHDHIVRLLIGDVFNDEVGEVFEVMREFQETSPRATLEGRGAT